MIQLYTENENLSYKDECSIEEEKEGLLTTVFKNGELLKQQSLREIRRVISKSMQNVNYVNTDTFLDI